MSKTRVTLGSLLVGGLVLTSNVALRAASTAPAPTVAFGFTNSLPGLSRVDYCMFEQPKVGDHVLHVLTPTLLELDMITSKAPDPATVTNWDLVNSASKFVAPSRQAFGVTADGQSVPVIGVGFKRRPLYAPIAGYDLRIENSLYLQLGTPIHDNQQVQVSDSDGKLWPASTPFAATADPVRYSPLIHVNQEGYMPNYPKLAMVGGYAGSLGEVALSASTFTIVDARTGASVFQGTLVRRPDIGYTYSPTPYQQVYQADFTGLNTPGQYRLVVPGLGGSLPFVIDEGVAMDFARAYALGLYHQRCGTNLALPYTRFTHGVCHEAPASVPLPASSFAFTWSTISNYAIIHNPDNPPQTAPDLTSPAEQRFPFVNQGQLDVSGGHHDAGDYSKYTINSASFIHYMMFAVDSLQGVAQLDNLGIPESGDGISDVMEEAKWEADFLAKMQDADGGFYFLVYPRNREYEADVTPDHGDPQVVWPKTTTSTAAAVAALAQCASSPLFKRTFPAAAALYMQKALLGWQFLTNAIARYGTNGAYQKITHYGDDFADHDELAWAACQMYLATGDPAIQKLLISWFDPSNPATWRWGWWHDSECYGHVIRSYAFAVQSGRVASAAQLDPTFLAKCQAQIAAAGDDALAWSKQCAYGASFPPATKAVESAGWFFSTDQAFDMAVAYQLNPKPDYIAAILANMNYEGGNNPLNVCFITGLGWKRPRQVVSQWALNSARVLPPSGLPIGNIQSDFEYLWNYQGELEELCFPSDGATTAPYPFYDRWGDSWNVSTEMVILNQARSLSTLAFLAAQTSLKTQAWQAVPAQIIGPATVVPVGSNVTFTLEAPGMDMSQARITWEARNQQPIFAPSLTYAPLDNGSQWVEAEAQWPDGRRVFAATNFMANSPDIVWIDDTAPEGATTGGDGGDSWNWVNANPAPHSGALEHQSALVAGEHQHFFYNATATLAIGVGDVLYAWVYLNPANPPSEVMLQWNDGTWEHRAYWGGDSLGYGVEGTDSRRYMGPLPPTGQWVQLEVPAANVGLEGATLNGMAFTLASGQATWDSAGRMTQEAAAGSKSSAGNGIVLSLGITAGQPVLTWASAAGTVYRISVKQRMTDTTWTDTADVTASAATTSWTDTTAATNHARFYRVEQVR
jgi:Glycosyl hydrolase family 9/Cellulase N-terminal ig-like domain